MAQRSLTMTLPCRPLVSATSFGMLIAVTMVYLLPFTFSIQTVYAGQFCAANIPSSAANFRLRQHGEVEDMAHGWVWSRCSWGQRFENDRCIGQAIALSYQQAQQAVAAYRLSTGKAWQIPSLQQLASSVELACHHPALDSTIFPNSTSANYWSSTEFINQAQQHWLVNFVNGGNLVQDDKQTAYLRMLYSP